MSESNNPQSRVEELIENILGAGYQVEPQSRVEKILHAIATKGTYTDPPQSRVEALLIDVLNSGGGGDITVEALTITENGTTTAPTGTAYSPVTVDVEPDLTTKSITENGTYNASSDNADGYSAVTVDVEPDLMTKSITQNGTYTAASDGVDGYSEVTVNVSGGGGEEVPEKDVNFIDYDGTVLYSYTAQEALALNALPANPSHDGLTAQGWNWSLADIKTHVQKSPRLNIGQSYITSDGKTRLRIIIDSATSSERRTFYLRLRGSVTDGITIDWGDGTTEVVGTSTNTNYPHTYSSGGEYVVSISVNSGYAYVSASTTTSIYGDLTNIWNESVIREINLGNDLRLGDYALNACYALEAVSIPKSLSLSSIGVFYDCYSLKSITFGADAAAVGILGKVPFNGYGSIKHVLLPAALYGMQAIFQNCYCLQSIFLDGLDSGLYISSNAFAACRSLKYVVLGGNTASIGSGAFSNCVTLNEIYVKATTPPSLGSNALYNLPSSCIIYVPAASLATYQTATNWSAYASQMIGV